MLNIFEQADNNLSKGCEREVMDRIYDKLFNNDEMPKFPIEEIDDQCINHDEKRIEFAIRGNLYHVHVALADQKLVIK